MFTNRADVVLAPGLVADPARQTVRLLATATGIGTNDPIEFVLITADSDRAYEALARSRVSATALHDALLAAGLTPGQSPDPRALSFWPKGERTQISVHPLGTNTWPGAHPVEVLLRDVFTGTPPPTEGFVFVEAGTVPAEAGTNRIYAPDARRPHAIVSLYNEPNTVFDVPRLAAQSSVYGQRKSNPALALPADTLLEFTFAPEPRPNGPRVREGVLTVRAGASRFVLEGLVATNATLDEAALSSAVATLVRDGIDPFVRLRFDPALTLDEARRACQALDKLEREAGLRIEPPEADQLYYRAFLPDEENRERADRVAQPLELRLRQNTNGVHAALVEIREDWREDRQAPDITVTEHPLAGPQDVAATLATLTPPLPVLLVFAPAELTLGDAMAYITPARDTLRFVHMYLESPAGE